MNINREKQEILNTGGNILVTANPGTGKTLLLAHKYLALLGEGITPENILCLTFTEKAKKEMEDRIIKLRDENKTQLDQSKINVYTFHSYALNSLDSQDIISSNLLRFSIYLYIREKKILNYNERYILDTLVPKIENLIRYLKSFGILPGDIDLEKTRKLLPQQSKLSSSELEKFLNEFVKIYLHYENIKQSQGYDYADLLIEFLNLGKIPRFDYVLVDELQDVNRMEAEIALRSGKNFIAVGDKKQAIFGFQGGSIINFEMFGDSKHFILSENFRSTNQILDYSKQYFISNTSDDSHKQDLKGLTNALGATGEKPKIVEADKGNLIQVILNLIENLQATGLSTAVILRTNNQISEIAKALDALGIEYSTTFFSGSDDAKNDIITFLKCVLSNNVQDVKNAMFTPYFPVSIQEAFEYAEKDYENIDELLADCSSFKKIKTKIRTKYDLFSLFKERILPISMSYGEQYFSAAEKLNNALYESFSLLENMRFENIFDYLQSFDLATDEIEDENRLVLTTIHKAKGKEFDNVVYVPSVTKNQTNFVDDVVTAILRSKDINAEEELEEEILRINFVAFTRAKKNLYIVTDRSSDYINESSEQSETFQTDLSVNAEADSYKKDAYGLFVNREYDRAIELLESNNSWLTEHIHKHFANLKSLSFTSANSKPFDYLISNIMNIREYSSALKLGSEVHLAAEKFLKNEDHAVDEQYIPFQHNIQHLTKELLQTYPDLFQVERFFEVPFSDISDIRDEISFRGKIDAVFNNGKNYMIIDWKTDRTKENDSKHRQQLESYKNAFCELNGIDKEFVNVGIAFIGLRSSVNTGIVDCELDMKQPAKNVFNTFINKVKKILEWKNDPDLFLTELSEQKIKENRRLWEAVVDQYLIESRNRT